MARVGPYEFTHEWSAPNGDLYEVWNDAPEGDAEVWDNDVHMLINGAIVEWVFRAGKTKPPTSMRIVGVSRFTGPTLIPTPSGATIEVPQARYLPPGKHRAA